LSPRPFAGRLRHAKDHHVSLYWEKLSDGGEKGVCGWLKDRFGLSWQVTPTALVEIISDPDPVRSRRVMEAMMKMKKIVIADLKKASEGG
jgi:predicted 3-demethylubiquinone-9 3-methyltransferase (glyoxalase superfamily)